MKRIALALALTLPLAPAPAGAQRIAAAVDSIVAGALKGGRVAGLSVAVVRGRDTLVLKGYGRADIELDVPTPPGAVYEVGSVTKQFTAAAILKLVEQGKLGLDDELTKYLPSFPVGGRHVTLRHLLAHTSGLRSYTALPVMRNLLARRLPPDSILAVVASAPWDFEPGQVMVYNNSGFVLLGYIIEKVSGKSYADYLRENIFAPAGMVDTRYCDEDAIIPRRVRGYAAGRQGLGHPMYIAMEWPFSAGGLCSTAGDLVAWTRALHGGRVLGPAAYAEMIAPSTLADGTRLRYAKGLAVDTVLGHRAYFHGGAIPGFLAQVEYFPDDTLSVVVLANTMGPVAPAEIARAIDVLLLGSPPPVKSVPPRGPLAGYVGEYRGPGEEGEVVGRVATDSAGALTLRIGDDALPPLLPLGGDRFRQGDNLFTFVREHGRVVALRADRRFGYLILTRSSTP